MAGSAFDLKADEIVKAAVEILKEEGLDAVSMRTVASRLGVSPVPLYSRVGNKEDLLDAIADQVLSDAAPMHPAGETWQDYTLRWAGELRDQLITIRDIRKLLGRRRTPLLSAARALVDVLRGEGFSFQAAVEATQLVSWATIGSAAVEPGTGGGRSRSEPGSEYWLLSREQADALFQQHIRYLVQGLERDLAP
jgi:AcrR family transcriptional regulator